MDLFAGNFDSFESNPSQVGANQQDGDWSDFANFDNAFEGSNGPDVQGDDPFKASPGGDNIDEIFGGVKDHAALLEAEIDPSTDAVPEKVSTPEDDASSDEDDPFPDPTAPAEAP